MTVAAGLDIRPLSPLIGAEIHGLDLARPLGEPTVAEVRRALNTHHVIFFRDQELTPGQQADFARQFGTVTEGHPVIPALDGNPEVLAIDSREDRAIHFDPWFAADVEARGGYEWQGEFRAKLLPAIHPVVRTHPENGRNGLFVNPQFTQTILGLSKNESNAILDMLYRHCQQPELTCRFRWRPGSVAFWDNRATLHYALDDYGDAARLAHRVTLRGDIPFGPAMPRR